MDGKLGFQSEIGYLQGHRPPKTHLYKTHVSLRLIYVTITEESLLFRQVGFPKLSLQRPSCYY